MSDLGSDREIRHEPARFFGGQNTPGANGRQTILIVLNQQIHATTAFSRAWERSTWRIAADGGADRLLDFERNAAGLDNPNEDLTGAQQGQFMPDLIAGDLDSITPFATVHFLQHGVLMARDPDQYSSDFGKAIAAARALRRLDSRAAVHVSQAPAEVRAWSEISRMLAEQGDGRDDGEVTAQPTDVLLFSTLGGRVDQGIGTLAEMAREHAAARAWRIYLVTERSVSFVLEGPEGSASMARHVLHLSQGVFGVNCGILPIFGPAVITLRGFEWDVEDWPTEMGGNISTSQHVMAADGVVRIDTTARVLFTIELAGQLAN